MTEQEIRLQRINALAAKERENGLTAEEKAEQAALREEYRVAFRASLRGVLENTYIQTPDGQKRKLPKKERK